MGLLFKAWSLAGLALVATGVTVLLLAVDFRPGVLICGPLGVILWAWAGFAFWPRSGGGLGPG